MMGSRKLRIASMLALLVGSLSITGLFAPGASAAPGDLIVAIVNQPAAAAVNELITAAPHDPTGGTEGFVQVSVRRELEEGTEAVQGAEVSFVLAVGPGLATGTLNVETRLTNADGIATFGPEEGSGNPLSIEDANQPFTTDYRLIPLAAEPIDLQSSLQSFDSTPGDPSDPFDIWEDGCHGQGCNINVRNGNESYTAGEDVGLGASVVPLGSDEIDCAGQRIIFGSSVFFHATSGDGTDPVFLVTHITRDDMKAAPNNGQKHVGWCIGLKTDDPWVHNGAVFDEQTVSGQTLFVALAPKCPKKNASSFAPCFVSKTGSGGGSFIRGWVLGGDPPRRT